MKRLRKTLIFPLIFLVLLASSSCTGSSKDAPGTKTGPVNLNMLIVAGTEEMAGWDGIVDSFNASNTDIQVKLERLPGGWNDYNQKVTALIAAGTPPDIGRMAHMYMPQYASKGQVEDVSALVSNQLDMSKYYESAFEQSKIMGKYYGVPIGVYTQALFFNKTMFDAANVPYPSLDWNNPWTFDEFRETAKKLTKGEGANKQFGLSITFTFQGICNFFWSNGGDILDGSMTKCLLDQDANKEALRMLQDMLFVDKSIASPAQVKAMPSGEMFASDKCAMVISGQWEHPFLNAKEGISYGVAPMPKGKAQAKTAIFLDQYVIFKGSKNVDAAWTAIKSFIEEDAENIMVDSSLAGIPVLKSVAENRKGELFNPLTADEKEVWFKSIDFAQSLPFTPNWAELDLEATKIFDLVSLNEMTAEDGCEKAVEKLNALLSK